MTPEDIAAVERSLEDIGGRLDAVADSFYTRLFAEHPDVQHLFADDRDAQRVKFAAQLDRMVTAIRDIDAFVTIGRQLGSEHHDYGVRSRHYTLAGQPLLDSLADELGAAWTDDLAHAWRRAYALIAEIMQQGAATTG